MKKKKSSDIEDMHLFRDEVTDVKPITAGHIRPEIQQPRPVPKHTDANEKQVIVDMMSDEFDPLDDETGEELLFVRDGIQSRTIRKLKRGQFSIQGELDLHGLNVEAARAEVAQFLQDCQDSNRRCVRIIHGKGLSSKHKGPVLKRMVNRWLRQRKEVLAFCSTLPQHGGTGAIYVLLKNMNK